MGISLGVLKQCPGQVSCFGFEYPAIPDGLRVVRAGEYQKGQDYATQRLP